MSSGSLDASEIDFAEAFSETSVLFNYTLGDDDGSAEKVIKTHNCRNVVSKSVKREYEKVRDRRIDVVKSLHQAEVNNSLEDWEPPESLDLYGNDRSWCIDLYSELLSIGSTNQIKRRLTQEERKFTNGHHELFRGSNKRIHEVCNHGRDPYLISSLRPVIGNSSDLEIVCDAAAWSANGGLGTFLTSDQDHMLNNRERITEEIERNRESEPIHMMQPRNFLELDPDHS